MFLKKVSKGGIVEKSDLEMFDPSHPGEILLEEYLKPLRLSVASLAEMLAISKRRLTFILDGRSGVTALISLKLSKLFNTSPEFFLRLQQQYDLARARKEFDKN